MAENEALCLTEEEVERHPGWRGYAESAGEHPSLRGLLAVPLIGEDGLNYGLLQLLDKVVGGDFDETDERHLKRIAALAALTLDALAKVRRSRAGEAVPVVPRETSASFVQIEAI